MEPTITRVNPEEMHSNPAFTQAVVVQGAARTIYVGGQNAVDAAGQIVGAGDLGAQSEQVYRNLETVIVASGGSLHDIIKLTILVVVGQDIRPGFEVWQRFWGTEAPPPAVSMAFVAGLAHPDCLVEIEAIAVTNAG
jgi:enamine deaminase RidA (YjgF/YER057c/UK114 family)